MKVDVNVNKESIKMCETLEKCNKVRRMIWGAIIITPASVVLVAAFKYLPALIAALK